MNWRRMKKKTIKFKKGGYLTIEKPALGITVLEMDGKGFWEAFGKDVCRKKK